MGRGGLSAAQAPITRRRYATESAAAWSSCSGPAPPERSRHRDTNYWNNYFHAMMYTQSPSMQTLQVYLYNLIQSGSGYLENMAGGTLTTNITPEGLTAAAVTLSIIPIIALYPFVQRFLIKGITIGSVKG